MADCEYGDDRCPCQDGDLCHYKEGKGTPALHVPPEFVDIALAKKDAEIERLQALLKDHHDWHLAQGEVSAPDGDGGHVTWGAADAYGESDLCERTYNALPYSSENGDGI